MIGGIPCSGKSTLTRNVLSSMGSAVNVEPMKLFACQKHNDILVKLDRSAMASSLETRTPFLDRNVVEVASKVPLNLKINNKSNKLILRKILNNYIPQKIIDNH